MPDSKIQNYPDRMGYRGMHHTDDVLSKFYQMGWWEIKGKLFWRKETGQGVINAEVARAVTGSPGLKDKDLHDAEPILVGPSHPLGGWLFICSSSSENLNVLGIAV